MIKTESTDNFYIISLTLQDDAEIALHKLVGERKLEEKKQHMATIQKQG